MNPRELYKLNEETLRAEVDRNPFGSFKINDNWKRLEDIEERSPCSKCHKSRKYFCYTCCLPLENVKLLLPKISLPLKIDIIKHCREIDGKSTAIHAAIIAPEDVTIYTYPDIPDYSTEPGVILIYPNKSAVSLEDCVDPSKNCSERLRIHEIKKAVFIDSTWNQSKGIYKDSRIQSLTCFVLRSRISQFWRHQRGSPRWYLATIEAIHQLLIDYQAALKLHLNKEKTKSEDSGQPGLTVTDSTLNRVSCDDSLVYDNAYDDLLFFFRFMYEKIHQLYDHESLRSYKRPLT
nr:PREDICTED: DTW domain-containing protein 1 [Bemisia tabaci]